MLGGPIFDEFLGKSGKRAECFEDFLLSSFTCEAIEAQGVLLNILKVVLVCNNWLFNPIYNDSELGNLSVPDPRRFDTDPVRILLFSSVASRCQRKIIFSLEVFLNI